MLARRFAACVRVAGRSTSVRARDPVVGPAAPARAISMHEEVRDRAARRFDERTAPPQYVWFSRYEGFANRHDEAQRVLLRGCRHLPRVCAVGVEARATTARGGGQHDR